MRAAPIDRIVCTFGVMAMIACVAGLVALAYVVAFWHALPGVG